MLEPGLCSPYVCRIRTSVRQEFQTKYKLLERLERWVMKGHSEGEMNFWKSWVLLKILWFFRETNLQKVLVVSHREAVRPAREQMVKSGGYMKEQRKQLCSCWWERIQMMGGGYASVCTKVLKLVSWNADIFGVRYYGGIKTGGEEECHIWGNCAISSEN